MRLWAPSLTQKPFRVPLLFQIGFFSGVEGGNSELFLSWVSAVECEAGESMNPKIAALLQGFPFGAGPKNGEPLENVAWHFPKDTGVRTAWGINTDKRKKKKKKSRRFILCDGWNRISLVILPVTFTARQKAQNKTKKQEEKPTAWINTPQPVNRMFEASALTMLGVGLLFHHRALP